MSLKVKVINNKSKVMRESYFHCTHDELLSHVVGRVDTEQVFVMNHQLYDGAPASITLYNGIILEVSHV